MQKDDLPVGLRLAQPLVEPRQLRAIEVGRVEREELDTRRQPRQQILGRREGVVALAVHVERLVGHLSRIVVVAEHREELHVVVEQRVVRLFELAGDSPRASPGPS